ncbi:MAG: hypothetical protein ABSG96_10510 [Terracidiphilus sp.]
MGETDGLKAEKAVDESKVDETKAVESKPAESKVDKPKVDESPAGDSKVDEPKADEAKLDKSKVDEPKPNEPKADDSKVDESKIEQLLAVNRQLGIFLEEQLDTVLALRKSVAAIQGFIDSDPTLKKKYEKYLQSVKDDEASPSDIHAASRIRGVLSRLQRTGTI